MRCYLSKQPLADCENESDDAGEFRFVLYDDYDTAKPKTVMLCRRCYYLELKVQADMFSEKYGSFCLECGEDLTLVIDNYSDDTPCLCYNHLYGKNRIRHITKTLNQNWDLYDELEKEKVIKWINQK